MFLARIGHGSHVVLNDPRAIATGDIAGFITVGFRKGAAVKPATRLEKAQLGSAISPDENADGREVFSQIGRGTQARLVNAGKSGGVFDVATDAVRSYADINGNLTTRPDITARADEIRLNATIAAPRNDQFSVARASIGAGNYLRLQAGAPTNRAEIDTSVEVSGVNPLVDGKTLAQALSTDLSSLTTKARAELRAKLAALVVANTELLAASTEWMTSQQSSVVLVEGDQSGDMLVSTNAGTGKGVTLSSVIAAGDILVQDNRVLTRIGHGVVIELMTADGANGAAGQQGASAPARGGDIAFTEANVLCSAIRVETNNYDDVTTHVSATAGKDSASGNGLAAVIGSGNEVFLFTGFVTTATQTVNGAIQLQSSRSKPTPRALA